MKPKNTIDMTNKRYGKLTAIKNAGSDKSGSTLWEFICDCGTIKTINAANVRYSKTTSCGCVHKEKTTRHGMSRHRLYKVWGSMIQRCDNDNNKSYKNYGGRGIKVSDSWHDFSNFIGDMGDRPTPTHTIERVDNDQGYCKENCKWATRAEQNRNHRGNVRITAFGETMIMRDWANKAEINEKTIEKRRRLGWCDTCCITGGFGHCRKRH